eukprot:COSAG02_NODE_62014_length_267_cov_0.607143_1_plen_77_part_01
MAVGDPLDTTIAVTANAIVPSPECTDGMALAMQAVIGSRLFPAHRQGSKSHVVESPRRRCLACLLPGAGAALRGRKQ